MNRKYLEELCVWVESNTTTLSILSSHAEVGLGFLLIISLFSYVKLSFFHYMPLSVCSLPSFLFFWNRKCFCFLADGSATLFKFSCIGRYTTGLILCLDRGRCREIKGRKMSFYTNKEREGNEGTYTVTRLIIKGSSLLIFENVGLLTGQPHLFFKRIGLLTGWSIMKINGPCRAFWVM